MAAEYPILEVDPSWRRGIEDMGSKRKFWIRYQDAMWLFKQARPNTGEHWAEKIAAEIAESLGLPTQHVELAVSEGAPGCAVRSFLGKNETLVHGNELMAGAVEGYDKQKERGQSDHHFDNIVRTLESRFSVPDVRKRISVRFVGYLVLDALIGNTDRHHENWGVIQKSEVIDDREAKRLTLSFRTRLAPTFDHGSSLGRELLDEMRQMLLDQAGGVRRYLRKGTGGIFRNRDEKKGLAPVTLAELVASEYPELFKPWQKRIAELESGFAESILERVPAHCMSGTSKRFVLALLDETRNMILSIP